VLGEKVTGTQYNLTNKSRLGKNAADSIEALFNAVKNIVQKEYSH
jgi:protein-arginine kinase